MRDIPNSNLILTSRAWTFVENAWGFAPGSHCRIWNHKITEKWILSTRIFGFWSRTNYAAKGPAFSALLPCVRVFGWRSRLIHGTQNCTLLIEWFETRFITQSQRNEPFLKLQAIKSSTILWISGYESAATYSWYFISNFVRASYKLRKISKFTAFSSNNPVCYQNSILRSTQNWDRTLPALSYWVSKHKDAMWWWGWGSYWVIFESN